LLVCGLALTSSVGGAASGILRDGGKNARLSARRDICNANGVDKANGSSKSNNGRD